MMSLVLALGNSGSPFSNSLFKFMDRFMNKYLFSIVEDIFILLELEKLDNWKKI